MRRCESNVMDSMDYILTCEEDIFLGLVAAPCLGLVSSDFQDFQGWHVPTEVQPGVRCYQPRIWSKQWHTSIRRAWFIVTSNLRLGSSWLTTTAEITRFNGHGLVKKDFLILFVVDDVDIVHDVVIFLKLLLWTLCLSKCMQGTRKPQHSSLEHLLAG